MRKVYFVLSWLILFSSLFCISSCKKEVENNQQAVEAPAPSTKSEDPEYIENAEYVNSIAGIEGLEFVTLGKVSEGAFGLDYTPLVPEPQKEAGKINMSAGTSSGSGAGLPDESVIPGLRKLEDYKTLYYKEKLVLSNKANPAESEKLDPSKAPKEPFTVTDWGPQGKLPADVRCPSFYVLFSEPVVPLKALDAPASENEFMKITPPLKGVFRWYGSSLLSFDATEPANPLETYTITLSDKTTSLYGKKLTGDKSFSTEAESLKVDVFYPGENFSRQNHIWFDNDDVPFEAAKECKVRFNYAVKANDIQKLSTVSVYGKNRSFSVEQVTDDSVLYKIDFPSEKIDDGKVEIEIKQPGSDKYPMRVLYYTLQPFAAKSCKEGDTYGNKSNPVFIRFSHQVDENSVLGNLVLSPELPVTKDNISVQGMSIELYNLPVEFGKSYRIELKDGIKDIYGRKLYAGNAFSFTIPEAASTVNFNNSGIKILEAKFPHKMVFDYQNVRDGSTYTLARTKTPLSYKKTAILDGSEIVKALDTETRNQRLLEVVEMDPLLENGKGWVSFDSEVRLWNRYRNTEYKDYNHTTVQVTDLGVTVRYGINKVVAFVTRLSDGTPVKDAEVYWYEGYNNTFDPDQIKEFASAHGTTGENGLAVIPTDTKVTYSNPCVLVTTEDDAVTFSPSGHSPWRNGIYNTGSYRNAATSEAVTFMFSDRGLYKPSETVSFRGIERNLNLGRYFPWTGSYIIELKEDKWYRPKVISTLTGRTSSSGGFSGKFEIPSDLEPGNYKIAFRRQDVNAERSITINVAYFERLKFQSSIAIPKVPVTAGDTLQGTLSASYLAGGALSGASYSSSWIREPWYFTSDDSELKNFRFGPIDSNGGRNYISDDSGVLSANGEAKLSVTAEAGELKGVPYRYRVSAEVTDVSNMSISAQASAVVHPALYYLGLAKGAGTKGWAKAGQKQDFIFKMADLEGVAVKRAENPDKLVKNLTGENNVLKVTLSRDVWNLVKQNGVYGGIYTRYEKTTEVEETKKVYIAAEGKVSVTPSKVGYYTLTVEGSDAKGRPVLSEIRFFATGKGNYLWNQEDATSIRLTPDKNKYNPGEMAHILMESTLPSGDYLVTVEREGIFTEEIKHFDDGISVLDIPVARGYVPVVYVSVSSYSVRAGEPVHKYGEVDLDKPKGYYGVTELFVDPYVKAFSIDVKSAKTAYRPGEEASVTLTATRGGEPLANAEITLMAVDRGVLDLIDYHVPNPIDFFYNHNKFPLRVYGGDSRQYLMDPVTYEVKNLQGGDEGDDKLQERSDFNPTAVFIPVLMTDENGQVTANFKLPDTLTTYRVTAFGVYGDMLALREDEIGVRNPVNVQQVLPRRLRERDTSEVGVLLTNLDGVPHEMTVSLEMKTPEKKDIVVKNGVAGVPGKAFVDGPASHKVTVQPGQNITVYFDASATKAGIVNAVFEITSDIVNERLVCPLTIEKPYLYETFTSMGTLTEDEKSGNEGIIIPESVDNMGSLTVTLDATRLGTLAESVNYVFGYPYGCLEQQSAKVLPLIIFEDYIDVFGLEKDASIKNVRELVKSYLKDWSRSQLGNGGFPYWPSETRYDSFFVSLRIANICALAKERGYTNSEISINVSLLLNYLEKYIKKNERYVSDLDKAYYNYIRAMFEMPVSKSVLEGQLAASKDVSVTALTGLTAIKIPSMESELAEKCRTNIRSFMRPGTRGVDISQNGSGYSWWYNTDSDRKALALQFLVQMNKDDEIVTRLIWSLLQEQKAGYWASTATTARVLESMYTVIKVSDLDNLNQKATARINGAELAAGTFAGPAAKPVTQVIPLKDPRLSELPKDKLCSIDFEKEGNGSLYYTTSLKYAIPYENQAMRDEGLSLTMTVTDVLTGEEIKPEGNSTLMELENGRVYQVKINLSSTRDRTFIAVRAPVPSGAEILDATFVTSPDDSYSGSDYNENNRYDWGRWMSNQNIMDNEVQYFWDQFRKGSTTATFKFRAVRRGVFPVPPVTGECMYEPEVFGRTSGLLYTIK
ncbi:MAG: MG2 domain-containing protein [Treponema sp.]|nr:MG2 domain-containing protein [Treponema sp.]